MGAVNVNMGYAPTSWHVLFYRNDLLSWWDLFSPSDLRHCVTYGYVGNWDAWVVFDSRDRQTHVSVVPYSDIEKVLKIWGGEPTAHVIVPARKCHPMSHRLGHWCSTAIARVVGCSGSAWRPKALLKSLLREQAQIVKVPECHLTSMLPKKIQKRSADASKPKAAPKPID